MRTSNRMFALGTLVAVAAMPMLGAAAASAAGSHARSTLTQSEAAPTSDARTRRCERVLAPTDDYVEQTRILDLSGLADGTAIEHRGRFTFDRALEKRSVPDTWPSWGSPPDTESAEPHVLATGSAKRVVIGLRRGASVVGFEVQPGPAGAHRFIAIFARDGINRCKMLIIADGDGGAKLVAMSSRSTKFDQVKVIAEVDFAIAQLRYGQR